MDLVGTKAGPGPRRGHSASSDPPEQIFTDASALAYPGRHSGPPDRAARTTRSRLAGSLSPPYNSSIIRTRSSAATSKEVGFIQELVIARFVWIFAPLNREEGQAAVEYSILAVLIIAVCVGIITQLGQSTLGLFQSAVNAF